MTKERFINDIDNEKLIDTKGELSTIHYSDAIDFYGLWEFLNKLNDENDQLKQEKQLLYENIDLLKRFIENQGFKVKLDDELFRVI